MALTRDSTTGDDGEQTQVWMVERTYSTDAPNIMVITYATTDGSQYLMQERAINQSIRHGVPTITAAQTVSGADLASTADEETRQRYATEAQRMRDRHDPGDVV